MVISQLKRRRKWLKRRSYSAVLLATFWGTSAGLASHYLGWSLSSVAAAVIPIWIVVLYYCLPRGRIGEVLCGIEWIKEIIDVAGVIAWEMRKHFDREYQEERKRRQGLVSKLE